MGGRACAKLQVSTRPQQNTTFKKRFACDKIIHSPWINKAVLFRGSWQTAVSTSYFDKIHRSSVRCEPCYALPSTSSKTVYTYKISPRLKYTSSHMQKERTAFQHKLNDSVKYNSFTHTHTHTLSLTPLFSFVVFLSLFL